ncbi:MAG: hypothetical protein K1X78_18945 [Verrucomicrobiaceae bacterium]|nr:hypothetical protein [Verrucomicrobiaceae bacterium]
MWRFVRQFPKILLVAVVLAGSTFWFWWWWSHRAASGPPVQAVAQTPIEEKAPDLPSRVGRLFVANGDLYDVDAGEIVIRRWLKGDSPLRLWFDAASGKIIGTQGNGFVRYNLDGTNAGVIGAKSGLVVNEAAKIAIFARDRDIWRSEIDWQEFKLVNERRVTTLGQFMESFFTQNIILGSDKALIVRNMNALLRVNLDTGEVTPGRLNLSKLGTARSPDGGMLAGEDWSNRQTKLILYDVDTNEITSHAVKGNDRLISFLWLNKDRCAFLAGRDAVQVFERKTGAIRLAVKLPTPCMSLAVASPTGRYVFCAGGSAAVLADVETGKTEIIQIPGQNFQWIADDTLLMAREVPDSQLRGTWVKRFGEAEFRIENDPFISDRNGTAAVSRLEDEGLILFATRLAMFRMKGSELKAERLAETPKPVTRLQWIERWKN